LTSFEKSKPKRFYKVRREGQEATKTCIDNSFQGLLLTARAYERQAYCCFEVGADSAGDHLGKACGVPEPAGIAGTNAAKPDLGVRLAGEEAIRGSELISIHFEVSRFNVDEGILARVLGAEARRHFPLVDFIAAAGELLLAEAWFVHASNYTMPSLGLCSPSGEHPSPSRFRLYAGRQKVQFLNGGVFHSDDGGSTVQPIGLQGGTVADLAFNGATTRLYAAVYAGGIYRADIPPAFLP
jgi:hypothetical protein